jgi:hypothetical protein
MRWSGESGKRLVSSVQWGEQEGDQ